MASKCIYIPHHKKATDGSQDPQTGSITTQSGIPVGNTRATLSVGKCGPILMQDVLFTEQTAHFNRERIPERVVHARGAGAFGYFEVTHDITKYCKSKVFECIGKRTPIAVRFSTTTGEAGTADTVRDPRGFAVKFYTEHGNWDLVMNHIPIFFIRDPMLFPSLSHAQKRNPQTHLKDPNMFWDFISLRPESLHMVTHLFSDRGIPDGFRHMDGFGNHTFKLVNASGNAVYCKFHCKTQQDVKYLTTEKALALAGTSPDYALKDLFDAIKNDNFPSWTMYIQVMTFEQAEKVPYNPFDVTKVWFHKDFPLIPVGTFTLNRNPVNYFAEVEQLAFTPGNMPPGIEPSPDKTLHGRLFSYPDAQRYRLGVNYHDIPVNSPQKSKAANYDRNGFMSTDNNQGNAPNYFPNSFGGPKEDPAFKEAVYSVTGDVARYDTDEDNVKQVRKFYLEVLSEEERQRLCQNIASSLKKAQSFIQERAIKNFSDVHPEYGAKVLAEINKTDDSKKQDKEPLKLRQAILL